MLKPPSPVSDTTARSGAASDALVGASFYSVAAMGSGAVDALEWWQGGLVLLGIALVATIIGGATTWRRDVS